MNEIKNEPLAYKEFDKRLMTGKSLINSAANEIHERFFPTNAKRARIQAIEDIIKKHLDSIPNANLFGVKSPTDYERVVAALMKDNSLHGLLTLDCFYSLVDRNEEARIWQLGEACKLAYRKHNLGDESVSWTEVTDSLCDAICEWIGDDEFVKWSESIKGADE